MRKKVHNIIFLLCVVVFFLTLQSAHAVEKYGRKSISSMSRILSTPTAARMPSDRASELLAAIRKQIEMPRFDYNYLPDSIQAQFWKRSDEYFSETMRDLNSIIFSTKEVDTSLRDVENSIQDMQIRIEKQEKLVESVTSEGKDASKYRKDLSKYREEKNGYERQRNTLSERRSALVTQQQAKEETLFQQASELLTEAIAPNLTKILSDPELQRLRAKEYVDEAERNKFIVTKAKELGITSEDLEKVMDSAYLYMTVLTDYSQTFSRNKETGERILTYNLSGGIIWFKLVISEENQKGGMQLLKTIKIKSSASGNPDKPDPLSKVDADTSIFRKAVQNFASGLELETRKIDDFLLKTGITEVKGSKVSFPMGKREGLYIGQKFRVYERVKFGEQIKEKKKGFFYITKIGDNVSGKDELSYGKMIIRGAEPGMQVREFPTTGVYLGIQFRSGTMKIGPGSLRSLSYGLNVKEEVSGPVYALNITSHYDLGRGTKIPQLYVTIGGDAGLVSIDSITIEPYHEEPTTLYLDLNAGIMMKCYIGRIALYVEPLVQYQMLSLSYTDDDGNTTRFDSGAFSFTPNLGIEIALRENLNAGLALSYGFPITATDEWSGSRKPKEGSKIDLFEEPVVGPEVTYPKVLFGGYITVGF